MFWEDRLTNEQYAVVDAALRNPKLSSGVLYDVLTNNGLTPEEADELINIMER